MKYRIGEKVINYAYDEPCFAGTITGIETDKDGKPVYTIRDDFGVKSADPDGLWRVYESAIEPNSLYGRKKRR